MDEDLKCLHCKGDLQADNFTEQAQLKILLDWLCEITCIDWYPAWNSSVKPDCGQYGIIEPISNELKSFPSSREEVYEHISAVDEDGNPLIKRCLILRFQESLGFNLRVYRGSGNAIACDSQDSTTPHRSEIDVLRHIRMATYRTDLNDKGMSWMREDAAQLIGSVRDEENGEFCGSHAEMDLFVDVCTQASYPTDGSLFHWCVFNCEGKPLCLPPKDCEE